MRAGFLPSLLCGCAPGKKTSRSRFGSPVAELRNRRIPTHLESCLMISADRVGIARNRAESRNRNRIAESFARGLVLRIFTRKMTCSESRNCATALGSRATERREAASFSCLFFLPPFSSPPFYVLFPAVVCLRAGFLPSLLCGCAPGKKTSGHDSAAPSRNCGIAEFLPTWSLV